ncbi:MAG: methylated-DNA--[protein]-cysteine S-methyltransferase [Dehalococcoidia bacterium]
MGSASGLLAATLPQASSQEAERRLGDLKNAAASDKPFANLIKRLKAYFAGKRVEFPDKLDLSSATDFQRQVWELTKLIPYGEMRSYGWVAKKMGKKGARAVGQALARNRLPVIIPCHRVVASDGSLSGYSGGVGVKESLLRLETRG